MGQIKKIRAKVLPASAKYFGAEMKAIKADLSAIEQKLKESEERGRRLEEVARDNAKKLEVAIKKLDLYATQIYRKDGETNLDARIRLFSSIPDATGTLALYQSVNTKMVKDLATLCKQNGIDYWLWCGSAVAAVGRGKAIPWDDDMDVCMMREDLKKLQKLLKNSSEYQVSVVYDFLSRNRQYRFVSKNEQIFNFIDIVVCDWATNASLENDLAYKKLELEMETEMVEHPDLDYWRDFNYFFTDGSRFTYQPMDVDMSKHDQKRVNELIKIIDPLYEKYIKRAHSANLLCDKDKAQAVAYGLDNLFNAPKRKDIWARDMIFPTHNIKYENAKLKVAHREQDFCEICFPGWPYIPNDICDHTHMPEAVVNSPEYINALQEFVKD